MQEHMEKLPRNPLNINLWTWTAIISGLGADCKHALDL